jgi:Protein of unknown function (DUF1569)
MSTTAPSPANPPVKTSKVQGRRELHFANLDEMLADAEMLAAAPRVKQLGNWTLGQALGHLANAMDMAVDGAKIRPPWLIGLMGRMFKKQVLKKMGPGYNLPPNVAKDLIPLPSLTTAEGIVMFRTGVRRLKATPDRAPSPFLGRLTREESDRLQCSHAELHLSFFVANA